MAATQGATSRCTMYISCSKSRGLAREGLVKLTESTGANSGPRGPCANMLSTALQEAHNALISSSLQSLKCCNSWTKIPQLTQILSSQPIITYHYYEIFTLAKYPCTTHIFIHFGYFYNASSSPILLRDAPDYSIATVSELTRRSTTGKCELRT